MYPSAFRICTQFIHLITAYCISVGFAFDPMSLLWARGVYSSQKPPYCCRKTLASDNRRFCCSWDLMESGAGVSSYLPRGIDITEYTMQQMAANGLTVIRGFGHGHNQSFPLQISPGMR